MSGEWERREAAVVERAHDELARLCRPGNTGWRMSIPARPEYDSDLILSAALTDLEEALAAVRDQATRDGKREAWDEGWNAAVDSGGFPGDVNPYRAAALRAQPGDEGAE